MHAHTCRLDSLYETLPFCNCTSSDKKSVTEGEGARNLSSIQSKWGVNGSFFIREQLSKQGPVGERGGWAAQWQLNAEKGPFHACGNTVVQWWWYQMVILWCFDICSSSELLPYTVWSKSLRTLFYMEINEGLRFWKWKIKL